jgi:hypothetical protein
MSPYRTPLEQMEIDILNECIGQLMESRRMWKSYAYGISIGFIIALGLIAVRA